MAWQTFWMEPAGFDRVGLRRYVGGTQGWDCAAGFHTAITWTDLEVATRLAADGTRQDRLTVRPGDPRWPAVCGSCPYEFTGDDERQVWQEQIFRRSDTGALRALHKQLHPPGVPVAEAGATWDAVWLPPKWRGPDGISLMVRCPRNDGAGPGSDWPVDMPSTNSGGRWRRTGDPRLAIVTADPSISIGRPGTPRAYHGWLRRGVLSDPI